MKIPLKWLKEYLPTDIQPAELAERMTMAGTEVAVLNSHKDKWPNVYVGQIMEVNRHPNADRLVLVKVDWGQGQETVVTGAPNCKVGDKVVFARTGAVLIDGHNGKEIVLKPAVLRGVESCGMVCSERELGLSDEHEGILVLPADAPVGMLASEYLGEIIFDLELTPNRGDLMCVTGVARELGALIDRLPAISDPDFKATGPDIKEKIEIEINNSKLCTRYTASLIEGIKLEESPDWLKERLIACGMRPINNVVDATNYVMLEFGQPLHAFDYDQIKSRHIIVRPAAEGEVLTTLDGVERKLSPDMLLITEPDRIIALAGVMGGENTEVTEKTSRILLESATFDKQSIRKTARGLKLQSEASARFEKGLSYELAPIALKRATQLILEIAGGQAASGLIDVLPNKKERNGIVLSLAKVNQILGYEKEPPDACKIAKRLGFIWLPEYVPGMEEFGYGATEDMVRIYPGYWRMDIETDIDMIEEVARIAGYHTIPCLPLDKAIPKIETPPLPGMKRFLRQILSGYGFQELISYSFTSREMLSRVSSGAEPEFLAISNPMSSEQEVMRTSLRPSLYASLAANRRFEKDGLRLYELGRVYLPKENKKQEEPEMLCAVIAGGSSQSRWQRNTAGFDFFDVKGIVESMVSRLGLSADFVVSDEHGLSHGYQAGILVGDMPVGILGQVSPQTADKFDITEPVYMFEINLSKLITRAIVRRKFNPINRFPAVERDLALVIDRHITNRQVIDILSEYDLVKNAELFDMYQGKQIAENKKSLAYHLLFQSDTHTLKDEEVDGVMSQILGRLNTETGAVLRS
ncbi:phenylalanine--tRNA ligase subunit beta [Dehalococcoides mccartyi]|jgi:phenylalanyl-tRNA synthetase beta chain|uniref:Phenylalanine--tRNA ligase beta subunit n=1 Tax=Dehalococcoides mccartyi TaxID=61435 RepID=A0A142V8I1_9CHLR|nr:phenylalanine--tRNA ligase subunit beta [Dehalococcoides mccartyi]AII60474.1 phenylalanyl-tRNA synthetase subunit beta [Dehalococcoides mccartyi CG5]AMU86133.1 phenylalanyl-tRNA synthetase subunit beta [Dehalococcoides mccartyi]MBA2084744.1 Phenylalanyl-tRNA synthetase beta chain [Dehalococcoides mccartyi]QBX63489.1 phenylalanine--tRNA ligase subunit beta [Dehalococcoides mccartyi]